MAIQFSVAVASVIVLFILYNIFGLLRWIRSAKATGLPYVVVPCLETEVVSQLLTPIFRALYTDKLNDGHGWPKWCRFMIKDWSWEDKRRAHDEYGDVFLVVSPQGIICYCADAAMGWDVMNRRYDFTKPRDKYKILEPYGPNVATAEGSTYRFHVRMTAPSFGDGTGVNELVWRETSRQTGLLMQNWIKVAPEHLDEDINALTLAVISLAGFGKQLESVHEQAQDVPKGYKISFLSALRGTTHNMVPILLFPLWFMDMTPLAGASLAKRQLDKYIRRTIRQEKAEGEKNVDSELGARANLLHTVVHASGDDDNLQKGSRQTKKQFTEDEVMGNLFIYLLGGYETTANSIQYGLLVLAAMPDVQTKVIEELDRVYEEAAAEGRQELTYGDDFPKLEYTYGFMYETFRLYPGVTLITKMCKEAQTVQVHDTKTNGTRAVTLPPECRVYLSSPGVHYHPKYWEQPEELKPERWFTDKFSRGAASDESRGEKHVVAADKTRQMRGTLLTFSDGARACLGRKFAQAEYMAFLAVLLRRFRVAFPDDVDVKKAKADLDNKCAGKITLSPVDGFRLELRKRDIV
ncbi:hypothetical protein ONZ43_g5217 [Nemania bipapillata]|uniref:Uncharacterized protein n=1 Tax=Nemania bipapillata TaxID=110536 RepID=A0ACC2IDD5_9PEZI|nr:hypothetical protein ONZ43_g5217 [Nemania bipapillata]